MKHYKNVGKCMGTVALCVILACSAAPISAPGAIDDTVGVTAENGEKSIGGGQICHLGHENCTYVEAVEGHPCEYIEDEDEVVTVLNCHHVHDENCYEIGTASPADAAKLKCKHEHDEGCYEVDTATPGDASEKKGVHVHDEDCGYVKKVEGVRCNHQCEICDEIYGETAKWAYRSARAATGDFAVSASGANITYKYGESGFKLLSISGSGSVTVGMQPSAGSTEDRIEIDASAGDITVNLDGLKIETDWQPILIKGSNTVTLNLSGDVSSLKSTENLAAIQVGKDATLVIDADDKNKRLEVEANEGAAIGSAYSYIAELGEVAGNIIIANGTINATSQKTGIGSSGYGTVGDITIKEGADVTVNADAMGIGGGREGAAGDITITDGAVVNVTVKDGTGIGGGYSGKVGDITIDKDAKVTISATDNGIGSGYDGLHGAEAGNIVIDEATVTVSAEDTGIGNANGGMVGDIIIKNSEITASGKTSSGDENHGIAIGSGFNGKSGAINISNSTLTLDNWEYGIGTRHSSGDKDKERGTGKITIADCTITTVDCTTGIRGELSTISGSGDVEISGTLDMGRTKGTGISAGGNLDLKSGCNVTLDTGSMYGISVNGTMDVNNNSKLVLSGAGIAGDGNVTFHDGSDVEIVSHGAGIDLSGKETNPSSLVFSKGCKVFINDTYGDWPYYAIQNTYGTVTIEPGADVAAVSVTDKGGDLSAGTLGGNTCILMVRNDEDWAGKNLEIRDKDGRSLSPAVAFNCSESYKTLLLPLQTAGDYTLYVNGLRQVYLGGHWGDEEKSVFTVNEGKNRPFKFTEKAAQSVPVTGIRFTENDQNVTMKPNQSAHAAFMIEPVDATNQNVEVSNSHPDVVEAYEGEPGVIWLKAKKPGTATVTVKTQEGGYEAKCIVTVSGTAEEQEEYRLTIHGSHASSSGAGKYAPGESVSIHAGTYSGYTFAKWETKAGGVKIANINSSDTTVTMPEEDITIVAVWSKESGNTTPGNDNNYNSSSGGSDDTPVDEITRQYKGEGAAGSNAAWNRREDGTWTATVSSETPKSKWVCLNNPYAAAGQPKGGWFYFDENGTMKNGWFTDQDQKRYYLEVQPDGMQGMMLVGWHWIAGKSYYFGSGYNGETLGALVTGGRTRDGHEVNAAGEWIVDGVVQTR